MQIFRSTASLLLLAAPLAAQAGGDSETIWSLSYPGQGSFGHVSSSAGDVNGDGFDDILVGKPFADYFTVANAGSVLVYSGANGSVLAQFDGLNEHGFYGRSVASAGDVNHDGFDDILIGSPGKYLGVSGRGSAYLFSGKNGSQLFVWAGANFSDGFGNSVSSAGDVNGDGTLDILVGAHNAKIVTTGNRHGAAYVYSGVDGSLIHQFQGDADGDFFGTSVSGAGDVNADGFCDSPSTQVSFETNFLPK